jgi:acyl dehydratase
MLGAMVPKRAPHPGDGLVVPPLRLRWVPFSVPSRDLDSIQRLTELPGDARLDLVAAHFTAFRALMAVLTHPAYPLPIWRALQVRNRLRLLRPLDAAGLELEVRVSGERRLEKGLEVDLRTEVRSAAGLAWEADNTFYYRGSFPGPGGHPASASRPPAVEGSVLSTWRAPAGTGWAVGRRTGDLNPLHWSGRYARRLGFRRAFLHPPLVLGQCLARLPAPAPGTPLQGEAWVRGQGYEGDEVHLRVQTTGTESRFALATATDARPALVGRLVAGM